MGLAVRSIDAPPAVRQALAEVELELSQVAAELRNVVSSLSSPRADADGRVD